LDTFSQRILRGTGKLTTMANVTLRLTHNVVERLEREARKAGLSLEVYVLELILQGLDPRERAREYVEVAEDLLRQARKGPVGVTLGRRRRRCGVLPHYPLRLTLNGVRVGGL